MGKISSRYHVVGSDKKITRRQRILTPFMWILAIIWMIPVIGALLASFRTNDSLIMRGFWVIPKHLILANYVQAWTEGQMSQFVVNSFIITIPAVLGTIFLSTMSAYALNRFHFRLSKAVYYLFVAGVLVPFQVMAIPVFRLTNSLHVYNSYIGLIIFHMSFNISFGTFVLRNFMKSVPKSIFDSAVMDGAKEWKIFLDLVIPIMVPAFAALAILDFTWIFNDYFWALVLVRETSLMPVTTGLKTLFGNYTTNWAVVMAGSFWAVLPTLLMFLFLQKYFVAGLTLGSTKG